MLFELPLATLIRRWPSLAAAVHRGGLICGGYAIYVRGREPHRSSSSASALWTIGEMFVTPFSSATASAMAPDGSGSAYQGMLQVVRTAGLTGGPAVGVFAYAAGPAVPWWGCAAARPRSAHRHLRRQHLASNAHGPRSRARTRHREGCQMNHREVELLAIGAGPSNLALAVALEELAPDDLAAAVAA